jgi:hypothetical protein
MGGSSPHSKKKDAAASYGCSNVGAQEKFGNQQSPRIGGSIPCSSVGSKHERSSVRFKPDAPATQPTQRPDQIAPVPNEQIPSDNREWAEEAHTAKKRTRQLPMDVPTLERRKSPAINNLLGSVDRSQYQTLLCGVGAFGSCRGTGIIENAACDKIFRDAGASCRCSHAGAWELSTFSGFLGSLSLINGPSC